MANQTITKDRKDFLQDVSFGVDHALARHGNQPWGRHEFYAILKEEVDELWDAVKMDLPVAQLYEEIVQVAAVCARYAETGIMYKEWLDKPKT